MKLWLLRHGQAQPKAESDAQRALTAFGRQQVMLSAEHLRGQALSSILVSPYLRAQQSAELVVAVTGFAGGLQTQSWLTPQTDPMIAARQIDGLADGTHLLVAHQPLLGALLGLLVEGDPLHPYLLDTAALAEVEGDPVVPGGMRLLGIH